MAKNAFKISKSFKYKLCLVISCILGFSYLLFYSYYTYIDNTKDENLPLIKAPINTALKPEDPGGMVIPNKDKDIYKQMSGKGSGDDTIKTSELDENKLSKSKALDLINNQLKKRRSNPL